ncbi:hypothetical protein V1478_013175 [Vespula squamosa]|uniref:Uncharacterized protein n=1 Tax=Vespula squamosa TaxID=30214 RepID=A0ABD2AC99_VESSQ
MGCSKRQQSHVAFRKSTYFPTGLNRRILLVLELDLNGLKAEFFSLDTNLSLSLDLQNNFDSCIEYVLIYFGLKSQLHTSSISDFRSLLPNIRGNIAVNTAGKCNREKMLKLPRNVKYTEWMS